jgi:hypothetical protein
MTADQVAQLDGPDGLCALAGEPFVAAWTSWQAGERIKVLTTRLAKGPKRAPVRATIDAQRLTLAQASAIVDMSVDRFRRWADREGIPVQLTTGGHRRFALRDVERAAAAAGIAGGAA